MNDYKELVKALRCCGDASPFNHCDECPYEYQGKECFHIETAAADAIERLVKERDEWQDRYFEQARKCFQLEQELDAVVADLAEQRVCIVCKHSKTHIDDEPCNSCKVFNKSGNQPRFEWRGVQEDNT